MKSLDDQTRIIVEKNIDYVIKNPEIAKKAHRLILREQEIEPNLERILSLMLGYVLGLVDAFYLNKHKRQPNQDEQKELAEIFRRRCFELRQASISTRIEP